MRQSGFTVDRYWADVAQDGSVTWTTDVDKRDFDEDEQAEARAYFNALIARARRTGERCTVELIGWAAGYGAEMVMV